MLKSVYVIAAALAATSSITPLAAQEAADVHHSSTQRVALSQWIDRVQQELNRQLSRPSSRDVATGLVRIKFNCSEDGRTDKVAIARSSGSHGLDLAAVAAVKRIAVMHPLATGMKTDQPYYADIMFATEEGGEYRRRMASLRRTADTSNGWFKPAAGPLMASR